MKTLILSSTRCAHDYTANCEYTLMLLDESGARKLLDLVDRLKGFGASDEPQVKTYSMTIGNIVPIKVASSLKGLLEMPDAELDVVQTAEDEISVCSAPGAEALFNACPQDPELFNTSLYLVLREDAITIEARPAHVTFSVYSQEIPLSVLQAIAGGLVTA